MSDACAKCGLECKQMLLASVKNAETYALPTPVHCLLVAMVEAIKIMREIEGQAGVEWLIGRILPPIIKAASLEEEDNKPPTWQ